MSTLITENLSTCNNEEKGRQLCENIYGKMPQKPIHLDYSIECSNSSFAAGKATKSLYNLILDLGEKNATIPITSVIPNSKKNLPAIIIFTAENGVPNKYLPAEELIDRGYAVFSLQMNEVAKNDADFKSGIAGYIARSRRKKSAPGKTVVWAWTILRVLEYVHSLDFINKSAISVAGHGICARAAMLAAGYDKRIKFVIANGIASSPILYSEKIPKSALTVHDYPYLYCPAFTEAPSGDEYASLLSLCTSRSILIGTAKDGIGLDAKEEHRCLSEFCRNADISFSLSTSDTESKIPTAAPLSHKGEISHHIRSGVDYFSREDWNIYLDVIDKKISIIRQIDNNSLLFN